MNSSELIRKLHQEYSNELSKLNEYLKGFLSERFPIPQFLLEGKRLRPLAVMLMSESMDERVLKTALSVELVHASSLVHDDIIDEDEVRRNFPTINVSYGRTVAILAGDYLFVKSMEILSELGNMQVMKEVVSASKRMVKGELEEEILPTEQKLKKETYLRIIYNKTASLFEASFVSGAILSENSSLDSVREAGKLYGMAYQIIDDCEDFLDGKDKDKITLPVILTFEEENFVPEMDFESLRELAISKGAISRSAQLGLHYLNQARKLLPSKHSISMYVDYLEARILEVNART